MLVTFDLFSALVDSRTGGTAAFGRLAGNRGWDVDPARLYDVWDRANKASQRDLAEWTTFAGHSARALAVAYRRLGLDDDPGEDAALLLAGVGDWPLWPDVADGLPEVAARHRVGVLSNVDDAVFARTRVAPLVGGWVDGDGALLTSERLHAYKPAPELYRRARERAGGALVHVATSARDVAGALAAGIPTVRLRRPGHVLDPAGPAPVHEAGGMTELLPVLAELTGGGARRRLP